MAGRRGREGREGGMEAAVEALSGYIVAGRAGQEHGTLDDVEKCCR